MKRLTLITCVGFSLFGSAASAITPASPEQVLCSKTVAFIGTVVEARSHDCRRHSKEEYCSGLGVVGATVKIEEVIQPIPEGFDASQTVNVGIYGVNGKPMKIGDQVFAMNNTGGGFIGFPPTGRGISDAEARQVLVGKQYVFAISKSGTDQTWLMEPYFASAYDGPQRDWARQEWSSADCNHWRHN